MKTVGGFIVVAAVGIVVALLIGGAFQSQPEQEAPDLGAVLTGTGELVEAVASNNVEFVRQVFIWSTWANGVYLAQTMPYVALSVAGAILALGLGLMLNRGGGRRG
jgi:hypothetical protein